MFGKIFESVTDTLEEFVENPVSKTLDMALQPVSDAVEIIGGLTEGELRTAAALRLGADVASGMAVSELLDWYEGNG